MKNLLDIREMNIKKFRKTNNISQQSLAEFAGVTQGAVSQWESGLTNIPSQIFQRLLSNGQGWDTSALLESDQPYDNSNSGNATRIGNISGATNSPTTVTNNNNGGFEDLVRMIEELKEQNKAQREQISGLTEIIKNLTAK